LWRRRAGACLQQPDGHSRAGMGPARRPLGNGDRAPPVPGAAGPAMIPTAWSIARSDLTRWRRSPALVAATLIPAAGMSLTVLALTFAVGRQPVALVREGYGPVSERVVEILRQSDGFFLRERTPAQAAADLENQWVS